MILPNTEKWAKANTKKPQVKAQTLSLLMTEYYFKVSFSQHLDKFLIKYFFFIITP